jgi:hypothetical protein
MLFRLVSLSQGRHLTGTFLPTCEEVIKRLRCGGAHSFLDGAAKNTIGAEARKQIARKLSRSTLELAGHLSKVAPRGLALAHVLQHPGDFLGA